MNEYLKPCPCCGGMNIAVLRLSASNNADLTNVLCAPKDGGCGLTISRPSRTEAVAAWNFRTPSSKPAPWVDWHGGDAPPVPNDELVDIKLPDGGIQTTTTAGEWDWAKDGHSETSVVAYRVSTSSVIPTELALDAERYRKWVSYSQFSKKRADEILDRISINEFGTPAEQLDPLPEDWCLDGTLIYRVTGDPHPENSDEIRVTLARGLRDEDVRERLAAQLFALLTGAPHGAITEDWVNRCLDAAHTWADEAYASGRGKPHQSLADARRALRRLLMEPLALSAAPTTTPHATASDR
jgi:hypothetical protein